MDVWLQLIEMYNVDDSTLSYKDVFLKKNLIIKETHQCVHKGNVSTTAFLASEVNVASSDWTQVTAMKQRLVTYMYIVCH